MTVFLVNSTGITFSWMSIGTDPQNEESQYSVHAEKCLLWLSEYTFTYIPPYVTSTRYLEVNSEILTKVLEIYT